jgi:hypothetical protein
MIITSEKAVGKGIVKTYEFDATLSRELRETENRSTSNLSSGVRRLSTSSIESSGCGRPRPRNYWRRSQAFERNATNCGCPRSSPIKGVNLEALRWQELQLRPQ